MADKSFFYKSAKIYKWGLRWLHGEEFDTRYKLMASYVGKKDVVLEPGCGPVILAGYLPAGAKYMGFDANPRFVDDAKRSGWKVWLGNALEEDSYRPADVVVLCDVYHHMDRDKRQKLIKLCWKAARKKLVMCEPWEEKHDGWVEIKRRLAAWGDRDGINQVQADNYLTREELNDLIVGGFGAIGRRVKREMKIVGSDAVVVFSKR